MIELFTRKNHPRGQAIKQKFDDLVIAYRYHEIDEDNIESAVVLPKDVELPAIKENGSIITGESNQKQHIEELERELKHNRSFTGDACYIDPDSGKLC